MKLEGSTTLIHKRDSFMLPSDKKVIQVVQSADEPELLEALFASTAWLVDGRAKKKEIINRLTEMDLPDLNMINQKVPIFSRKQKIKRKVLLKFLPLSYNGRGFVIWIIDLHLSQRLQPPKHHQSQENP